MSEFDTPLHYPKSWWEITYNDEKRTVDAVYATRFEAERIANGRAPATGYELRVLEEH